MSESRQEIYLDAILENPLEPTEPPEEYISFEEELVDELYRRAVAQKIVILDSITIKDNWYVVILKPASLLVTTVKGQSSFQPYKSTSPTDLNLCYLLQIGDNGDGRKELERQIKEIPLDNYQAYSNRIWSKFLESNFKWVMINSYPELNSFFMSLES